eukprot:m.173127 g.173127  ORF g.173127 m.173127 type:complete len:370 (-) comp24308_c0_seq1:1229-2338(-)
MSTADKNQAPVLTPLIVGAGNPTVDVTAHVTRDELSGLGIHPGGDLSGASQSRKEEVVRAILSGAVGTVVGTSAGGSALNTVRVAAWGQGGRFDSVGTAFVGAVGDDAHARLLEDAMVQCGVISLLKRVDGGACTAVCAALVEPESRDRSLAVVRGAAEHIDVSHLDTPAVAAALVRATVIYVTAFMLSTPPRAEMINALARIASTRHPSAAAFALNISSVSLVQKVGSAVLALLSQCCWLFGATEELYALALFAGADDMAGKDTVALAVWAAERLPVGGRVVITAGPNPTIVVASDGGEAAPAVFPVDHVPQDEIVDTNGCGDSFVGGFLSRVAVGAPLAECVAHGHRCAGAILRRRGCDLTTPLEPL